MSPFAFAFALQIVAFKFYKHIQYKEEAIYTTAHCKPQLTPRAVLTALGTAGQAVY